LKQGFVEVEEELCSSAESAVSRDLRQKSVHMIIHNFLNY
jgi:hypothetical protein